MRLPGEVGGLSEDLYTLHLVVLKWLWWLQTLQSFRLGEGSMIKDGALWRTYERNKIEMTARAHGGD